MRIRGAGMVAVLLLSQPLALLAQQPRAGFPNWRLTPVVGIGYVANAPQALLGGGAYLFFPWAGGIGIYGDFKVTHESYENDAAFQRELTVEQAETEFGDQFMRRRGHWSSASVALARPLTPELALYVGTGYARETVYREYLDTSGERGFLGHYRVEDTEGSGARLNLMGGGLFRIGRNLLLHFGGETAPRGVTVGASYLLPLR